MSQLFSSDPIVSFQNAAIVQDKSTVLHDVNFTIEKGEFVYLTGRTGEGKTSLLKTIYADLPLQQGLATVTGQSLFQIKPKDIPILRRKLGIIFQDFQLFYDRSVAENLQFVMKATGWTDSAKMKNQVSELLHRVGLGNIGKKMPHQLSGGEQQRLVIARALVNEPLLLVADEPTGNLDPEVTSGIMDVFMKINNSGTSVIMATHNHQIIQQYPARVMRCANTKLFDIPISQL